MKSSPSETEPCSFAPSHAFGRTEQNLPPTGNGRSRTGPQEGTALHKRAASAEEWEAAQWPTLDGPWGVPVFTPSGEIQRRRRLNHADEVLAHIQGQHFNRPQHQRDGRGVSPFLAENRSEAVPVDPRPPGWRGAI